MGTYQLEVVEGQADPDLFERFLSTLGAILN